MPNIRTTTQFSVFLVNKPGILAQVTGALAEAKINLTALTLADAEEHGVLRCVAGDVAGARDVLKRLNLPTTETEVIVLDLNNSPGALAEVAGELGRAHINISYAYCTGGAPGGHTSAVLKVADIAKSIKVLGGKNPAHKESDLGRRPGRRK